MKDIPREQADSIQGKLDKINALLNAMLGQGFGELLETDRVIYVMVLQEYLHSLETELKPMLKKRRIYECN